MFYALSEKVKDVYDKLSLFVALGPVTKITYQQSLLITEVSKLYGTLDSVSKLFGIYEVAGANWFTSTVTKDFCGALTSICEFIESFVITSDPDADDEERFAVYMGHTPNGASV